MIVLALDTALPACSVAVLDGGRVLACLSEPMTRGHQERLAPMAQEAMAAAGLQFTDLDRIGVTVGPGSFTGLRVGLAFAKGLSLALDIPCLGVGSLPALAASTAAPGLIAACIDAKRGQVYLELFEAGQPLAEAEALSLDEAVARLA
ncbi:MAG: tsaB, partial [Caulobacter sp.]|nr:tsaB [Caulobacter sp.]